MVRIIRDVIWPKGIFSKLGRILGALSAITLIQYGFNYGFATTVLLIVEYYDNLVHALLGWAEPYLVLLLAWININFDWTLKLFDHWRHIFVLLGIYFFRSAAVNYSYGYRSAAVFGFAIGFIIALATSVAAGSIPMLETTTRLTSIGAVIPIVGIFLFDVLKQLWNATFIRAQVAKVYENDKLTWWEFFRPNLYLVITQMLGSLIVVWVILRIPWVQELRSPTLFSIGILIVLLAFYRVGIGANEVRGLRKKGESWFYTFNRTASAGIATAMFGLFFWLGLFLFTSAGLRFYGL